MAVNNTNEFVWVVAYIDSAHLKTVVKELAKYPEYNRVEAYIPTVKILKKTFKKEDIFEEIPLLFNYGFFKVPREYAVYRNYLDNMQKNVSCIYGWVKDPSKGILANTDSVYCATATSDEIADLIKKSGNMGAHSADDLALIKPGDMIILRGYPFDGMEAELVSVDEKRQRVMVNITIFDQVRPAEVSYDNVFFTVYHNKNYDENANNMADSLDAVASGKIDKVKKK